MSERSEIEALLERRVEACRVKDIEALMALFAPEIVYFDVVPPLRFLGLAEVRRNFLRWFAEYDGPIGLETRDSQLAAGSDVAFAHMLHRDSGNRNVPGGKGFWLRSTTCLKQASGAWRITHEHISFPIDFRTGKVLTNLEP
jgi:ketosteroid isomerase-like protein